jgi:GAF domain-containing protein
VLVLGPDLTVPGPQLEPPRDPDDDTQAALADRLRRVVDSAVELLRVDGIGLMLLDDTDRLRMAGFTSGPAAALEQVQVELGLGPGIDASRRAETVAVEDLAQAADYASLWQRTARIGVRAVLASPVWVSGTVVGNLNALRDRAHRWSRDEIRANEAYARVIGITLDLAVAELDDTSERAGPDSDPARGARASADA